MNRRHFIVLAVTLSIGLLGAYPGPGSQEEGKSSSEIAPIVKDLETALYSASLKSLSGHLGKQLFLSLKGGESGYFSVNQAHFVLEDYFSARKVVSLHFNQVTERDGAPYVTGSGTVRQRGATQPLQVFVSFARLDGRWVIAQLNVY